MPIHLPPISRRRFLTGTLAAGAGLLLPRRLAAREPSTGANHFVLLADTHIAEDRDQELRGVKPVPAFEQAVGEILALDARPAGAIIAGDCAFLRGLGGDYATLRGAMKPLRQAGVPVHLALGNHDDREHILAAFPEAKTNVAGSPPDRKLISVLETPHANWFLLDSLEKTNTSPGLLGGAQLAWLAKSLDARADKPALVLAHHNPSWLLKTGLRDAEAMLDVLTSRKQVKAYFFGHTHEWHVGQHQDVHLVNLPAVAWAFTSVQPRGFVTAQLHPDGATLVLQSFDRKHAKHGEKIELKWRT